jgi:hypothetical protein
MQKSKRITTARLKGVETPGVNQHRSVSDKVAITNGRRNQWNCAQYGSMATCTETMHLAS